MDNRPMLNAVYIYPLEFLSQTLELVDEAIGAVLKRQMAIIQQ